MLSFDALTARRAEIDESPDLSMLRDRLMARAAPVLVRMPFVPQVKALLSRDGGICPDDQSQLVFDPWRPDAHRCPTCSRSYSGERHAAHWARAQHLWIVERAAHLATLHAVTGDESAARRAREMLAAYYELYFQLPNSDNVLGPSHLFFSTYLESIWLLDFLAAAFMLREMHALDDDEIASIDAIANEAATIVAEFNEGMSNRQTWNSAALTAIATWFGDEDLAVNAVESRTGLVGHLADGFGTDGMWWEGENYHLFALRGLLVGLQWARTAGADLLDSDDVAAHLGQALMAPADSSLPDFTFPARKDARYGVSLAHPAYLECWESGYAALGPRAPAGLPAWLSTLYQQPSTTEQTYDAYLHEAGEERMPRRGRSDLSWWALLVIAPELPAAATNWSGSSRLMEQQGLAILRHADRYLSLECGGGGGGHGHPDRLHLTLFAGGVHWLPDPGTGSYVSRDLFWYRSTLAHNAPLLDEVSQAGRDAGRCAAFAVHGDWAWSVGEWQEIRRTVVAGPRWILDVVHLDGNRSRQLDLPWHLAGEATVPIDGVWEAEAVASEFVSQLERFIPANVRAPIPMTAIAGDRTLRFWFAGDGDLLRGTGPDLPGRTGRRAFYLRRTDRNTAFIVTVIDLNGAVTAIDFEGSLVRVHEGDTRTTAQLAATEATIASGADRIVLGGAQPMPLGAATFVLERPPIIRGQAVWADPEPPVDGTLRGFNRAAPLALDEEYQYYRSETPYPGADAFSATAYVNWSDEYLHVAVDVTKDELVLRPGDALPLALDNEPDDINSDGIQVYFRGTDRRIHAWMARPLPDGTVFIRPIGDTASDPGVAGAWSRTARGYSITVRLPCPHLATLRRNERLGFDVIVNEMQPGRVRRAGQLIWSGGPGWVYLRGDRHDPAQFGELELLG
jgi:hypothetical protein